MEDKRKLKHGVQCETRLVSKIYYDILESFKTRTVLNYLPCCFLVLQSIR